MAEPSTPVIEWATDTNYTNGPFPGQPNREAVPPAFAAEGWVPEDQPPAEYMNEVMSNHSQWLKHFEELQTSCIIRPNAGQVLTNNDLLDLELLPGGFDPGWSVTGTTELVFPFTGTYIINCSVEIGTISNTTRMSLESSDMDITFRSEHLVSTGGDYWITGTSRIVIADTVTDTLELNYFSTVTGNVSLNAPNMGITIHRVR